MIWLHGLGADGHDFEPLVPMLGLPRRIAARFVFPHAPERPVTINAGMRMRAWYDIVRLGGGAEDSAGIRESQALLEGLIARERGRAAGSTPGRPGVPPSRANGRARAAPSTPRRTSRRRGPGRWVTTRSTRLLTAAMAGSLLLLGTAAAAHPE